MNYSRHTDVPRKGNVDRNLDGLTKKVNELEDVPRKGNVDRNTLSSLIKI